MVVSTAVAVAILATAVAGVAAVKDVILYY